MGFSRFAVPTVGLVRTGEERAVLVRRTYSLVFAGVVVSMLGAWWGLSQPALMQAVAAHPIITFLCALAPMIMAQRARAAFPQNIALIFLFTLVMGVSISPLVFIGERVQPGVTLQAGILTLSTFGVLTAYAWLSRRDFSAWGAFFSVGLFVLIATSLLNIFFHNQGVQLWIAGGAVLVFSGLLVFDTWRLRNVYGPDDYVQAAVLIFLDLFNLFVAILQLLLGGRRQ